MTDMITPRDIQDLFRGFTAAASLKRIIGKGETKWNGPLPRLHRRGLIEAGKGAIHCRSGIWLFRGFTAAASLKPAAIRAVRHWDADSSAASPPRPH